MSSELQSCIITASKLHYIKITNFLFIYCNKFLHSRFFLFQVFCVIDQFFQSVSCVSVDLLPTFSRRLNTLRCSEKIMLITELNLLAVRFGSNLCTYSEINTTITILKIQEMCPTAQTISIDYDISFNSVLINKCIIFFFFLMYSTINVSFYTLLTRYFCHPIRIF